MSPNKRKNLLRSLLTAHLSCGCSGTRSNHHAVHQPKPRPKPNSSSSSSNEGETTTTTTTTTTTFSPVTAQSCLDEPGPSWPIQEEIKNTTTISPNCSTWKIGESIAVEKESKDPYEDFRHSMLQMIFENQIMSAEDLHHLLQCFLRLNSPDHHHVILRAFFQVCDAVVSSSGTPPPSKLDTN